MNPYSKNPISVHRKNANCAECTHFMHIMCEKCTQIVHRISVTVHMRIMHEFCAQNIRIMRELCVSLCKCAQLHNMRNFCCTGMLLNCQTLITYVQKTSFGLFAI